MSSSERYIPPPVSEIIASEAPMPPPRALSREEGAELIRRMNQPGGHKLVLDADEQDFIAAQPPVREPAAIDWLVRELTEAPEPGSDFYRAVCATVDFAFGRGRGPLSGEAPRNSPPTCSDIEYEESVAVRYIHGQTSHTESPLRRSQDYSVGVEHTCLWLRCATGQPPWGAPIDEA
ncbi:hypothetical protein [Nocardiopsis baichengensis]|uniref:hypothetical protein n=1 Tax=Nocardiopsis baichengensis TaxID=280240 RepID=UPI000344B1EF|nr:hypothetical protein [Nocardiopsis baichengensis]